jgi:hypothetical protein
MDLFDAHKRIVVVGSVLCSVTANIMKESSTVRREVMGLQSYRKRRGL